MAQFKYITDGYIAVVFSETESHADVARRMFPEGSVKSAGFGRLNACLDGFAIDVSVYGESTTLKLQSQERDEWLVRCALGLYGDL